MIRQCRHGKSLAGECLACEALWRAEQKKDAHIERLEDALRRIVRWSEAYPLAVFPEPEEACYAMAREVLEAHGMTLDRLSAAAMRHVVTGVGRIAGDALSE